MTDWRVFCAGERDIIVDGAGMTVEFSNGREQRIDAHRGDGVIEFRGIVARRAVTEQIERVELVAWERNRAGGLVGFRVDERGVSSVGIQVPIPGLTREEFLFYLRSAAAACDLFEYQLTGKDRE